MSKQSSVHEEIIKRFEAFIEDNDLSRVSRNIRIIFFDYLRQQTAGLDVRFEEILHDVEAVMDFLDFCCDNHTIRTK